VNSGAFHCCDATAGANKQREIVNLQKVVCDWQNVNTNARHLKQMEKNRGMCAASTADKIRKRTESEKRIQWRAAGKFLSNGQGAELTAQEALGTLP